MSRYQSALFGTAIPYSTAPSRSPVGSGLAAYGAVSESRVFDGGVLAVARGLLRPLQHPVSLGEVDVAEQRRNHPALRNALFPARNTPIASFCMRWNQSSDRVRSISTLIAGVSGSSRMWIAPASASSSGPEWRCVVLLALLSWAAVFGTTLLPLITPSRGIGVWAGHD